MLDCLPSLRRYARNLTGSVADGDDLTQEVCAKALERRAQWDPSRPVKPWLLGMMHNQFIDDRRADGRRREGLKVVAFDQAQRNQAPSGEARVALAATESAMRQLPGEQRAILMLVCVEGLTYRETADALDLPIGTVMSRLSRARAGLAAALDDHRPLLAPAGGRA
jgi:RNA polymerase sigma-70 factor (ECF subfamily)